MIEFVMSALPWIFMGVAIAMFAANHSKQKKAKEQGEEGGNYMTEGMCIGLCVGVAIGGNALCYGMLAGIVIGMLIKKENGEQQQ